MPPASSEIYSPMELQPKLVELIAFHMSDDYGKAADEMWDLLWILMQQVWVMKEICEKAGIQGERGAVVHLRRSPRAVEVSEIVHLGLIGGVRFRARRIW
jgi:hypothetical protein